MISGVFLNKIPQNARNCNRSAQTRHENQRSGTARCISVKNTKLSGVFWLESPLISIRKYDMIALETAPDGKRAARAARISGEKLDHIHTPDPVMIEIEALKKRLEALENAAQTRE